MEHCNVLVENISEYLSNLEHHKQHRLRTPLYHPRKGECKHVPPPEWLLSPVSLVLRRFPQRGRWQTHASSATAAAASQKGFGGTFPSDLPTSPAASPLHPGARRAVLRGIQLRGGRSPGPRGCTSSSASPGTRHQVLRCDASQQPAPGSTGPQTGLVSRRKRSFPNRSSLSWDPVLGRTAPLTWLLIHLPYWFMARRSSWERAASATRLPWLHVPVRERLHI